jgi:hypothetical protein
MTTKHPRINLVVEKPLFEAISVLAKKNDMSLSMQAKMLILASLDMCEDVILAEKAGLREQDFSKDKAITHDKFWEGN